MIFGQDRESLRQTWREAWRKARDNAPLSPLEAQIAQVVEMHPEYHRTLESAGVIERDYTPDMGESNPFLHMGMHLAIHEQVSTDRPAGIAAIYRKAMEGSDAHTVEHRFIECLGKMLWEASRSNAPPDEQAYLACLRKARR